MKTLSIALLTLLAVSALAQRPATASLQGVVVSKGANEPVANATIELREGSGANTAIVTTTTLEGKFTVSELPPGTYKVSVTRSGYLANDALTIDLAPGQQMDVNRLTMIPGGVISGVVTDRGKPLGNIGVYALRISYDGARHVLTESQRDVTNDRGEYRIFWLSPGRYNVAAIAGATAGSGGNPELKSWISTRAVPNLPSDSKSNESYPPSYFPGTPDWRAAIPIEVQPGSEVRSVNIDNSPLTVRHVRGAVTSAGAIPPGVNLTLTNGNARDTIESQTDASGTFDIPVLVPGSYMMYANANGASVQIGRGGALSGASTSSAAVDVRSNTDINNINLSLAPGLYLSVQVIIESQAGSASVLDALNVTLRPDHGMAGAPDYSVSRFALGQDPVRKEDVWDIDIPAGSYRVTVEPLLAKPGSKPTVITAPRVAERYQPAAASLERQNAYVKSIKLGDADILNDGLHLQGQPHDPLIITVAANGGRVEGHIVSDRNQSVAGAAIVLIPVGGLRFRVMHKYAVTDGSGKFQLQGVAPGDYKLYGWENVENGLWQDPDFVEGCASHARLIHIDEGAHYRIEGVIHEDRNLARSIPVNF